MTNSSCLARELDKECNHEHRHVHLINGRAKHTAIYLDKLSDCLCKGIRKQIDHDVFIKRLPNNIITAIQVNSIITHNDEPDAECFYDHVSGAALNPKLVREARRVEM